MHTTCGASAAKTSRGLHSSSRSLDSKSDSHGEGTSRIGSAQQVQATSPQLEEADYEEGEEHDQGTVSITSPTSDSATEHLASLAKAEKDQRVKRLLARINDITGELEHRRDQLKQLLEGREGMKPRATSSSSSASLPSLATPPGHVASTSSQPTPSVSHEMIAVNLVMYAPARNSPKRNSSH